MADQFMRTTWRVLDDPKAEDWYVTILDLAYLDASEPIKTGDEEAKTKARRYAQWAVAFSRKLNICRVFDTTTPGQARTFEDTYTDEAGNMLTLKFLNEPPLGPYFNGLAFLRLGERSFLTRIVRVGADEGR